MTPTGTSCTTLLVWLVRDGCPKNFRHKLRTQSTIISISHFWITFGLFFKMRSGAKPTIMIITWFFITISVSKFPSHPCLRADKGIAWNLDMSSMVCTVAYWQWQLANQIVSLLPTVVQYIFFKYIDIVKREGKFIFGNSWKWNGEKFLH